MKRILIDSHVRIDINLGWFSSRDPEAVAKRLESEALREWATKEKLIELGYEEEA